MLAMPAGFHHAVLASSAEAVTPALALPPLLALCAATAESGGEAARGQRGYRGGTCGVQCDATRCCVHAVTLCCLLLNERTDATSRAPCASLISCVVHVGSDGSWAEQTSQSSNPTLSDHPPFEREKSRYAKPEPSKDVAGLTAASSIT
jgi:hypothetical protein